MGEEKGNVDGGGKVQVRGDEREGERMELGGSGSRCIK